MPSRKVIFHNISAVSTDKRVECWCSARAITFSTCSIMTLDLLPAGWLAGADPGPWGSQRSAVSASKPLTHGRPPWSCKTILAMFWTSVLLLRVADLLPAIIHVGPLLICSLGSLFISRTCAPWKVVLCRHTYSDNLYIFCYALNNSYNSENDCKCGPNCNCADCNCHKWEQGWAMDTHDPGQARTGGKLMMRPSGSLLCWFSYILRRCLCVCLEKLNFQLHWCTLNFVLKGM